ncbi:MAG: large-conductance mechanosensitive channel protein MscL [Bacteroidetes bacterium]|nr:large-conductance mechanosensitive channel protein MscL [Bacteroidota bacterium]HET6243186.1 large-conductance mechanosensitive channel protein MscL [Bacteroidia bacterium]
MSIIKEFKEFAMKGNLIDMAVAFVMGVSFGKVVSGFIDGIVMPVVGKIISGVDFKSLKYILSEAQIDASGKVIAPETSIKYGEFITILIDFILVAFFMFMVIKTMNKLKKKQEVAPVTPHLTTLDQKLLKEIRDLLKK